MWKERDELKKDLLSKEEPELNDLEGSQPIHIAKNEKACSNENTNGVTRLSLDKEFTGFCEQKHYQFELKEMEMGQNEDLDLLNLTGRNYR